MQSDAKVNILLVDDNINNLIALEAILETLGENIIKAGSAEAALKFILERDFAVILLDVQMPEMNGFEVAKLVRERERSRHTPIIFLTANNKDDRDIIKGYQVGGVDYILKPFVPEILKAKVSIFVELFKKTAKIEQQKEKIMRAQEVNRLKDEFIATVSHELRTPLTAILGWARILRSGKLDEHAVNKAIDTIERNARSQAQLIEDLLDVSRIITGKLRLELRPLELIPIIKAAIEVVKPVAEVKEIEIRTNLDRWTEMIYGDPMRLQQIIWNLLNNAIKFTPTHGVVEIRLERLPEHAQIIVSDTGKGIRPEFLDYIFDRFSQADSSSAREHTGLGLGLAIVRHLVELHGGSVEASSKGENQGANFIVKLPLKNVMAELDNDDPIVNSSLNMPHQISLKDLDILVVEDEPDTREMLVLILEQYRANVKAAYSVPDALEVMENWWPDIILSDINLPGRDGYDLIRRVRSMELRRKTKLPAIAITAQTRAEDRLKAISAGFTTHIPKPIEPAEVVTVIASLTGRSEKI